MASCKREGAQRTPPSGSDDVAAAAALGGEHGDALARLDAFLFNELGSDSLQLWAEEEQLLQSLHDPGEGGPSGEYKTLHPYERKSRLTRVAFSEGDLDTVAAQTQRARESDTIFSQRGGLDASLIFHGGMGSSKPFTVDEGDETGAETGRAPQPAMYALQLPGVAVQWGGAGGLPATRRRSQRAAIHPGGVFPGMHPSAAGHRTQALPDCSVQAMSKAAGPPFPSFFSQASGEAEEEQEAEPGVRSRRAPAHLSEAMRQHALIRRARSMGDIMFHAQSARLPMHAVSEGAPEGEDDGLSRIGKYTLEERRLRILRYRQKRQERNFDRKIKYACRKTLADSRPRVRGRFAKNDDSAPQGEAGGSDGDYKAALDFEAGLEGLPRMANSGQGQSSGSGGSGTRNTESRQ